MTGMEEMVAGEIWMIASSISSFLSPHGIVFFFFLFVTIVPLLVRITHLFCLSFFSGGD